MAAAGIIAKADTISNSCLSCDYAEEMSMTQEVISQGEDERPFPAASLSALVVVPAVTALSRPMWAWYYERQLGSIAEVDRAPNAKEDLGIAVVGAEIATGATASIVGFAACLIGSYRKELCRGIRILACLTNCLAAMIGLLMLAKYFASD